MNCNVLIKKQLRTELSVTSKHGHSKKEKATICFTVQDSTAADIARSKDQDSEGLCFKSWNI